MARILISASFDGAAHSIALAELLRRSGHEVAGLFVVNPLTWKSVRNMVRQRGLVGLVKGMKRWLNGDAKRQTVDTPLQQFLKQHEITDRSLREWAKQHKVPYHLVSSLNEKRTVQLASQTRCDGLVYSGGGILKQPIIDGVNQRVLNAHSGPMPDIRGMNALEWSLLLGIQPAITIHWIERGIDTGPILEKIPAAVKRQDTVDSLRSQCAVLGIKGLVRHVSSITDPMPAKCAGAASSRQCYVLAPALHEILERRLEQDQLTQPQTGQYRSHA